MKHPITTLLAGLTITTAAFGKTIPNHATANLVLGQVNFTTSAGSTTQTGLRYPSGIAIDPVTRKVFVADKANSRVLRYGSADGLANGAPAEAVLGQVNFTTVVAPLPATAQSMDYVSALCLDRLGRLWVADRDNNRVLMFAAASAIGNTTAASRVYGQPDFSTTDPATSATKMDAPRGLWVDSSDRLWVADTGNSRVLRFDAVSNKSSGAAANGVLGQPDFTSNAVGNSAASLKYPIGLAVAPSGALFVACGNNHRVVRFDNASALGNGGNASVILGQQDFSGSGPGLSAIQMNGPYGLTITPDDTLWVCEASNNRLIRFDQASSKASGAAANGVIGQPNFLTNTPNTTSQGLNFPFINPFVDATGSLWVPDSSNSRILRFPADTSKPVVMVSTKVKKKPIAKKAVTLTGTASDPNGITLVQYQVNKSALKTATGTTNWSFKAKLKKGRNKITVIATDPWGDVSVNQVIKIKRK